MQPSNAVQRVRIYLNESDQIGGRPRYLAALELLREAGATGATAVRGVAGFGVSQQLHLAGSEGGRSMPVVIDWIDRTERVARIMPSLDALLPDALITVEQVHIYRATLRQSGPFGEHSVGELAVRNVATLATTDTFANALALLLHSHQNVLPVLDEHGRLAGVVGAPELRRRTVPALSLLRAAHEHERAELLASYEGVAVAAAMSGETLSLTTDSSVLQAAKAMIEWGVDEVPILARNGDFHGLFGVEQALSLALSARSDAGSAIRDAEAPMSIGVLMQGAVQTVLGYALATTSFERLLAGGETPLVVVDNGKPLGLLELPTLLRDLDEHHRAPFAAFALRGLPPAPAVLAEVFGETRVASLPLAPLPSVPTTASYDQAIALLHHEAATWLAAVDEGGKLQGIVGRRTLLRALVQQSGA